MNEFLSFNKALFSSIKETLTGGNDAQKSFTLRQKLKAQTYQAMLKFWGAVTKELSESEANR